MKGVHASKPLVQNCAACLLNRAGVHAICFGASSSFIRESVVRLLNRAGVRVLRPAASELFVQKNVARCQGCAEGGDGA